jgi:hypothetical protein
MEDSEMDEVETVVAAAFNAHQEFDDLENSTTLHQVKDVYGAIPRGIKLLLTQ